MPILKSTLLVMKRAIKLFAGLVLLVVGQLFFVAEISAQEHVRQTREEYISRYHHIAVAHMEKYGIPASITLAQGILESDCGNSQLSRSSNNHFGIKCKSNWRGRKVYHDDDERGECFRAYPSVEASYEDHAEFLDRGERYDSLFAYSPSDYKNWARGLKAAGYATAPDYAERLIRIIEDSRLYLFDREGGEQLYADAIRGGDEEFFDGGSAETVISSTEGVDPDNFHVTINAHNGYNVHRNNGVFYVLAKERDSYENIGEKLGYSARNLRKFNDVEADAQPLTGEVVYIGRKRKSWQGNVSEHIAREGETLYSLSQLYAIRLKSLKRLNGIKSNEHSFEAGCRVKLK